MTLRAFLLGIVGIVLLCGITYYNSSVLKQTMLIGNYLPIGVYGSLALFLVFVQPLLTRRFAFSGRELVVAITLVLAVCVIPASGFLRTFFPTIVTPHHFSQTKAGWEENQLLEMVPDGYLADPQYEEGVAVRGLIEGLAREGESFTWLDVPWAALAAPLSLWLPLALLMWLWMLGLSLVLHKQWSDNEHLPYPLAKVVDAILPEKGRAVSSIFQNKFFLWAAGVVMVIHLNNYAFSQGVGLFQIDLRINFKELLVNLPSEYKIGNFQALDFTIYFSLIGVSFFLARDVSLAIGVGPILWSIIFGTFAYYGVSLSGQGVRSPQNFVLFGGYLGLCLAILYTGRHFYWSALMRAVGLGKTPENGGGRSSSRGGAALGITASASSVVPSPSVGSAESAPGAALENGASEGDRAASEAMPGYAVWGMRLFLAALVVFITLLWFSGLDLLLAVIFTLVIMTLMVGMSRIIAEAGVFFVQAFVAPAAIIVGIFGFQALGPEAVVILGMVGTVLMLDNREAFMPYVINNLKLLQLRRLPRGHMGIAYSGALVLGLLVAVPVTGYLVYAHGFSAVDAFAQSAPIAPFTDALEVNQRLAAQGALDEASQLSGLERLGALAPAGPAMVGLFAGVVLTLLFVVARLYLNWWPLHPILFLMWIGYFPQLVAMCFLLGWLIKVIVSKYCGEKGVEAVKPFMVGLIVGELVGALIPAVIGLLTALLTGNQPNAFSVFPN